MNELKAPIILSDIFPKHSLVAAVGAAGLRKLCATVAQNFRKRLTELLGPK
jgi:hypothetical protein